MKSPITSTHLSRLIASAIFGAFALGCAAVSIAADKGGAPQVVVKFGDLNLSNPKGAAALYARIGAAAYELCKPYDISSVPLSQGRLHACVSKLIAKAVNDVGRPELIAIYNARNPRPLTITVAASRTR